jgi:hypothetical protein
MLAAIIIGAAICAILGGVIAKLVTDRNGSYAEISKQELLVGSLAIMLVVAPLSGWASYKLALVSRATYSQYVNGYEVSADVTETTCSRDGFCRWDYDCDPYIVTVSYECGDGKTSRTCYRDETRYHECPYVTHEYHYRVNTTVGTFTFADHRFPLDPDSHRWRFGVAVPGYIATEAGVGPTPMWLAAKARVADGKPGPVTAVQHYDNYVLASERTVFKQWSGEAQRLDSAKMLPPITRDVVGFYDASKVSSIKWAGGNWNTRLAYLNSVAGPLLQTDVRLVIVRVPPDLAADTYTFALQAYWQDSKRFGMYALPKNALVYVLGTEDGKTVAWARAITGMPMGNEALIAVTRTAFNGKPLDIDTIIGNARNERVLGKLQVLHGAGVIERLTFGLDDPQTKFARLSMKAEQSTDIGTGFLYLKGEIRPSTAGWFGIAVATLFACALVWIACLFIGQRSYARPYSGY